MRALFHALQPAGQRLGPDAGRHGSRTAGVTFQHKAVSCRQANTPAPAVKALQCVLLERRREQGVKVVPKFLLVSRLGRNGEGHRHGVNSRL